LHSTNWIFICHFSIILQPKRGEIPNEKRNQLNPISHFVFHSIRSFVRSLYVCFTFWSSTMTLLWREKIPFPGKNSKQMEKKKKRRKSYIFNKKFQKKKSIEHLPFSFSK